MPDGATLREHLQALAQSTGRIDPRLAAAPLSREAQPIWEIFVSLSATRRTGLGSAALTMVDIEAWCRLYRVRLTSWELDTLLILDARALAARKN